MVCAGFHISGSEDPERCASTGFGDSGGPLVCRAQDTGYGVPQISQKTGNTAPLLVLGTGGGGWGLLGARQGQ